ncbi:hypothetical protein Ahy_B06g080127 [Arachis hypogaea]|uniref:Uncharacterized protein n=1 Tax=Arachis hypogaea TaxID=3818 RepID=A0A444YH44_ARAHY|nr:hypothetical protein Ahy_B06g080127 [Arachis hypogaea]
MVFLVIIPLQVFAPASSPHQTQQTTATSLGEEDIEEETINVPTQPQQVTAKSPIKKCTEEEPQQLPQESHEEVSPTKVYPLLQTVTDAIMMIANVVLKNDFPAPSFSLGFTQSSEEATLSQEDEPQTDNPILVEDLKELVEAVIDTGIAAALNFGREKGPSLEKVQPTMSFLDKFQTPVRQKQITDELKEKHFYWVTNIKTYEDENTNEWETIFILKHEKLLEIRRMHFESLKAESDVENLLLCHICIKFGFLIFIGCLAMCQILNTRKIERFQKLVYCLPLDIVNYTLSSHEGNFLHPKTKKPFQVEDYQDYLPFLDEKKLVSHLFVSFHL